jgi:hypothetical protein
MGRRRIFLKSLRDTSCYKDLSNEPNPSRWTVHLMDAKYNLRHVYKKHLSYTLSVLVALGFKKLEKDAKSSK